MMTFQLTASRRGWLQQSKKWSDINIFQLTASRRGWLEEGPVLHRMWSFQLTASRRGWLGKGSGTERAKDISTHSLTKRLTDYVYPKCNEALLFQLTASRRGWQQKRESILRKIKYFNSQPHEEADLSAYNTLIQGCISTHSLTKRLTILPRFGWWNQAISTHSLTKRLTKAFCEAYPEKLNFNSQPHEEADSCFIRCRPRYRYFNSQPHEEADAVVLICSILFLYFNSQPHEEADGFFQHQS